MKNLLRGIPVLFLFLVATAFSPDPHKTRKANERIEVSFNAKMEFNDLVKIKLDLAEAGISIDYRLLKFDAQGGLRSLEFTVDCHDGFSGGAENSQITNHTRWGFFRDYTKDSESPFGTGGLQ